MNSKQTRRQMMPTILCFLATFISHNAPVHAFSPALSFQSPTLNTNTNGRVSQTLHAHKNSISDEIQKGFTTLTMAGMIALSSATLTPGVAQAYEDYTDINDIDTVANVVQSLKDSIGNTKASFQTFESINEIITEGKGVGGMISSSGVKLERGFVADEDTTIYNPGLSLLTESEKGRIVDAVIQNKKQNIAKKTWSKDNEFAFDYIVSKLDPLHMVELKGYLGILPFYGAAVYLAALVVQQFARDLFPVAYIASAAAIFLPVLVLIAKGV